MKLPIITKEQNEKALKLSYRITDPNKKRNAYADFACAVFFADYMLDLGYVVSTKRSLFKCSKLYTDFEIIDVYCNSHRFYVLNASNSAFVKIPCIHKEYDILPEAYIVVKFNETNKEIDILGIIKPADIEDVDNDGKYYFYDIDKLRNKEELQEISNEKAGFRHSTGSHLDCLKHLNSYVKNKLTEDEKKNFILHILSCESCKKKLFELIQDGNDFDLVTDSTILKNENGFNDLRNVIDVIYQGKDNPSYEPFKMSFEIPLGFKKPLVLTMVTFFAIILLTVGLFSIPFGKKPTPSKEITSVVLDEEKTEENEDDSMDYDIKMPSINSNRGYTTVSNVSWEISSSLNKEEQKKFLQQAGKTIKLNLQNDLLLSSEAILAKKVKFEIRFYKDGNIEAINVIKSSGSDGVDSLIKQSLTSTLKYMKPPKGSFSGNKNGIILNIDF